MQKQKSWGASTRQMSLITTTPDNRFNPIFLRDLKAAENKELVLLRTKNKQLQQTVLRMGQHIIELEAAKEELIKLNSRYVEGLNDYFKRSHKSFQQYNKRNSNQKTNTNISINPQANPSVFEQFHRDYRGLVRHCLALQEQIKSKNSDLDKYYAMSKTLKATGHDHLQQLIEQLKQTSSWLVDAKKDNNLIQFQVQKYKKDQQRRTKKGEEAAVGISKLEEEVSNYKSMLKTVQMEAIDQANAYQSRIYELSLKVEKLERQLRQVQEYAQKTNSSYQEMRVSEVRAVLVDKKLSLGSQRAMSVRRR